MQINRLGLTTLALAGGLALVSGSALAQLTVLNPDGSGGYIARTPGTDQMTFFHPDGSGNFVVQTPGESPMGFMHPDGSGGYIIQTPGQPPTFVHPD
jgi:hypothetical protein